MYLSSMMKESIVREKALSHKYVYFLKYNEKALSNAQVLLWKKSLYFLPAAQISNLNLCFIVGQWLACSLLLGEGLLSIYIDSWSSILPFCNT